MTQKRTRKEEEEEEEERDAEESMANCLMLLSKIDESPSPKSGRIFKCKSCKKQFHSFQALGGHMASHKKLKLMASDFINQSHLNSCKPKKHECPICGVEYNMGQALGGHMRRHRTATAVEVDAGGEAVPDRGGDEKRMVAVLKRSNSKRVFGLDLNLMPFENELKLEMKTVPVINFFV